MKVSDVCVPNPVVVKAGDSIRIAAQYMKQYHVGSLIVVEVINDGIKPIGIITDRDIVLKVATQGRSVDEVIVDEVMSKDLETAEGEEDIYEALQKMRRKGVRRLPIVDEEGLLVGIMTVDDALEFIVKQLVEVVRLMWKEQARE